MAEYLQFFHYLCRIFTHRQFFNVRQTQIRIKDRPCRGYGGVGRRTRQRLALPGRNAGQRRSRVPYHLYSLRVSARSAGHDSRIRTWPSRRQ